MKRNLMLIVLLMAFAQTFSLQAQSEAGLISMTSFVPAQDGLSPAAQKNLEHRVSQIITKSGMGNINNSRFAVIPRFVVMEKTVNNGVPPMIVLNADITFYVGDVETGNVFGSYTTSAKGLGKNDTKAYISCINSIKPNDPELQAFMQSGKQKIIDYYNQKVDQLISKARQLESTGDYDGALAILLEIPEDCEKAFAKAAPVTAAVFQKKIDHQGEILYNQAYQIWSSTQTYDGAVEACDILAQIHPYSSSAPKARKLADTIGKRVKEIDQREWNFVLQQQKNEADITKALISAARDVGVAQAKQPVYNYNVVWW